jgi:osmotically-inducible protein OsmY
MRKMDKSSDIRAVITDDLRFDPDVDASDIRVEVMDGDVVLTGSVSSYRQYVQAAAEVMVAELTVVRRVTNDIQIRDLEQT